jgi:phospholipid/cholesterol/gamma-HCH transport system permease protein
MDESSPRIDQQDTPDGGLLIVLGAWTAAALTQPEAWRALTAQLGSKADAHAWDLQKIEQLDHLGAQVLWDHWGRQWPARIEVEANQRAVLETVAKFAAAPAKPARSSWNEPVLALGNRLLHLLDHM